MIKISHIVTNGCSFTEGNGLSNKDQAWPYKLAHRLGVDVVNIGKGGSANDTILRRTYEYFYEDIPNKNLPLYVIMFSSITRKERWLEGRKSYATYNTHQKDPGSVDYVLNFNMEYHYRRTMIIKSALTNLFKIHNVPHMYGLAIEALKLEEKNSIQRSVSNRSPTHYSILKNDKNDLGDMSAVVEGLPLTPCMHWGEEAHGAVAHHIFNKIHENYGGVEVHKNKPYLTLDSYVNTFEKDMIIL